MDELHRIRYAICMKLGYDDGIKGRQSVFLLETDIDDLIGLFTKREKALLEKTMAEVMSLKYQPHDAGYEFILAQLAEEKFQSAINNLEEKLI